MKYRHWIIGLVVWMLAIMWVWLSQDGERQLAASHRIELRRVADSTATAVADSLERAWRREKDSVLAAARKVREESASVQARAERFLAWAGSEETARLRATNEQAPEDEPVTTRARPPSTEPPEDPAVLIRDLHRQLGEALAVQDDLALRLEDAGLALDAKNVALAEKDDHIAELKAELRGSPWKRLAKKFEGPLGKVALPLALVTGIIIGAAIGG